MTHTALRQYPTPHQVKSSDQVIFPFISYFPMMSHCVSFYYSFSFWFIIWFVCCLMTELSGRFLWLIAEQSLTDLRNLLSCSEFPMYIKEAVLPQRKDNQVQDLFLAQLSSARSKNSTILITTFRISQQFSWKSQPLWLHHQSVSTLLHQAYFSVKVSKVKKIFQGNTLNISDVVIEVKFLCLCLYLSLGEQLWPLNYCVPNTTRK